MTTTTPTPATLRVAELAKKVAALSERRGREQALRHAMSAAALLLQTPTDALRVELRSQVFQKKFFKGAGYQVNDFEVVDYAQYELEPSLPLFRGPALPQTTLERGDYFCVVGAAQTFGRLVQRPWPVLLGETLGLPVLNLSRGAAGPDFFLNPKLIRLVGNARFVVLQVMSGRSIGCTDYPGGRRIMQIAEGTGKSKGTGLHRWDILEKLWDDDPRIAIDYVGRWNANYLEAYRELRRLIERPTLLLWLSARRPDDWKPEILLRKLDWGYFPQLVGRELYERSADLFDERFEYVHGQSPEKPLSRITGEVCPYFGSGHELHTAFSYYPPPDNHATIANALLPWAKSVLGG